MVGVGVPVGLGIMVGNGVPVSLTWTAKAYENIAGWDTFDIQRTCCRVICPGSKR